MSILASPTSTPLTDALARARRARGRIEDLIRDPAPLGPDLAAVRRIDAPGTAPGSGALLGWRATPSDSPDLAEARRLGLTERLDWALRCRTFDLAVAAGLDGELHLAPQPETFGTLCPPRLAVSFLQGRRSLTVVAALLPEAFQDTRTLLAAVEQMRSWGWQLGYTDVSGGPAEAAAIDLAATIRPAYQHLDVRGAPSPALLAASRAVGATGLAVGVDDTAALLRARALGAVWGCGALIGPATAAVG